MADRRVRTSGKDAAGDITALCNPGETWSPRLKEDVIDDIESKLHTYYVEEAGGRADVQVVHGENGKYLRSTADSTSKNNLDNLPGC